MSLSDNISAYRESYMWILNIMLLYYDFNMYITITGYILNTIQYNVPA